MTEACMRQVTLEPETQKKKGELSGKIIINATELGENNTEKPIFICSRCGKKGHTAKYCHGPAPIHSVSKHVVTEKPKDLVSSPANTQQGNWKSRAKRQPRAKIEIRKLPRDYKQKSSMRFKWTITKCTVFLVLPRKS